MIPDYLIIEEKRRQERERNERSQRMPLRIPLPMHERPYEPEVHDEDSTNDAPERGVCIIDLNTYETTRL